MIVFNIHIVEKFQSWIFRWYPKFVGWTSNDGVVGWENLKSEILFMYLKFKVMQNFKFWNWRRVLRFWGMSYQVVVSIIWFMSETTFIVFCCWWGKQHNWPCNCSWDFDSSLISDSLMSHSMNNCKRIVTKVIYKSNLLYISRSKVMLTKLMNPTWKNYNKIRKELACPRIPKRCRLVVILYFFIYY